NCWWRDEGKEVLARGGLQAPKAGSARRPALRDNRPRGSKYEPACAIDQHYAWTHGRCKLAGENRAAAGGQVRRSKAVRFPAANLARGARRQLNREGPGHQTNPLGKGGDLMTRGNPSRAVFAALLALGLLVNFSLPAAAAPTDETGPDGSVVTQALTGVEGAHFGFSRVLNQISSTAPGSVTNTTSPPAGFPGTPPPGRKGMGGRCTSTGGGTTGT